MSKTTRKKEVCYYTFGDRIWNNLHEQQFGSQAIGAIGLNPQQYDLQLASKRKANLIQKASTIFG